MGQRPCKRRSRLLPAGKPHAAAADQRIDAVFHFSHLPIQADARKLPADIDLLLSECDIVSNTVRQKLRIVSLPSDHAPAFSV